MQIFKNIFLITLTLAAYSSISSAAVWEDNQLWNDEWEEKFSNWIKSSAVHKEIFVSASSPYKGIIADCADVAYVFRAIFSFENKLAFSAKNPLATTDSTIKVFSNKMTRFDHITNPHKRLIAFANYLGQNLGTETLVANDSFPLKLDHITAGDVFLYKVKKDSGFIRHNYNIKNIDKRGNFEVIYSTQAVRDQLGAPLYHREIGLYHAPIHYKWGFRRYHYGVSADTVNSTSYKKSLSHEQFDLAKKLGERAFFAHVKSLLRLEVENPDSSMKNNLKELCDQVTERIDIVNKALAHQKILGGKCMEYGDYDAHSTPSRDGRLKDIVNNLQLDYQDLTAVQKNQLSLNTLYQLEALFEANPSEMALESLKKACPINYKPGTTIHLRDIRLRISKGLLSSHPNDSVELRWGESNVGKTKCKAFY